MDIEHLVATLDRKDDSFLSAMRLRTDTVVINQCGRAELQEYRQHGQRVVFWSLPERGVGRSRNRALEKARGDILLFSDDDLVYLDGYAEKLTAEFLRRPEADVLLFNIRSGKRKRCEITRPHRVRWYNYMRYGAGNIAVRRKSIAEKGITFSTEFGGGTKYGSGEDSLFLRDCLKRRLRLYAVPVLLAETSDSSSTWFTGFNDKYYFDKGALFTALAGPLGPALCLVYALKHMDEFSPALPPWRGLARMFAGMRHYRKEKRQR